MSGETQPQGVLGKLSSAFGLSSIRTATPGATTGGATAPLGRQNSFPGINEAVDFSALLPGRASAAAVPLHCRRHCHRRLSAESSALPLPPPRAAEICSTPSDVIYEVAGAKGKLTWSSFFQAPARSSSLPQQAAPAGAAAAGAAAAPSNNNGGK